MGVFYLLLLYFLKYKIPDKYFQKKINNIEVECQQANCQWKGALSDYRVHHNDHFVIKPMNCEYCHMTLLSKDDLERHLDKISGHCSKKAKEIILKNSLFDRLDRLEKNQIGLISDLTRMTKNNDKLKQENQVLRENIKEYKTICQDTTLALTQVVSLLTLEERLINQEKLSYDGTLLWKITNVHERILEAKSGRQTSFYSPPFYTDPNGYKMCAKIYLNGDVDGRNTHLSLFFVILRGEYDALLKWPFRQKVTFILIDQSQSESKENVYDAFRPDPNSSSFRRPISEMNIASGLPVFCPLGKLMSTDHEYIKDNTMFIKIIVDTKDLNSEIS